MIGLKILPLVFAKRKSNSSHYNFSTQQIFWRIDWVFSCEKEITLSDENVCEKEKLKTVLSKYFKTQEDAVLQESLQFYQSTGINNVHLLLKAENKSTNAYYELDGDCNLLENLRNKAVIEYPTIYVVLKHNLGVYNILETGKS